MIQQCFIQWSNKPENLHLSIWLIYDNEQSRIKGSISYSSERIPQLILHRNSEYLIVDIISLSCFALQTVSSVILQIFIFALFLTIHLMCMEKNLRAQLSINEDIHLWIMFCAFRKTVPTPYPLAPPPLVWDYTDLLEWLNAFWSCCCHRNC